MNLNPTRFPSLACVLLAAFIGARAQAAPGPAWKPLPMITAQSLRSGVFPGGEGAQAIRCLAISPSDPRFLLLGTDVGGVYRSLDGGKTWQVCMVGWDDRGANALAFDPKNPKHVLGASGNSGDWDRNWGPSPHGLYLSDDAGGHWTHVLAATEGNEWRDEALAFDPSSYDAKRGLCTVTYWESRERGLLKSVDGGKTWARVNARSGAVLKVHPTRGFVYLGDGSGFYKSADGGKTFRQISETPVFSLDVIPTQPDRVYAGRADGAFVSTDSGEAFRPVGANAGLPVDRPIRHIRVSPADPKVMIANHGGPQWWESYTLYSRDGGATWRKTRFDSANAFLPINNPGTRYVFHPTDPKIAYGQSGGYAMTSRDGGASFQWSNNRLNDVMLGGSFGFSPLRPDAVYLSFQDYNGAATSDGGKTWTYCNPAGNEWGGYEYAGLALDAQVMWTGDAPGWYNPRNLKVSRDGGKTWIAQKDADGKPVAFTDPSVSCADPADPNVGFASHWRTADRAKTWAAMTGCEAVFTFDPTGQKELYGKHGDSVCVSADHGQTWRDITPAVPGGIKDIAFDPVRRRLYAASEGRVKACDLAGGGWRPLEIPLDDRGQVHCDSVCVDPVDPSVVYGAGAANQYATSATVYRSCDAGKTWTNLTVTTPLAPGQPGGPHEVNWVRVHPATRALWAAGECYGLWILPAPTAAERAAKPVPAVPAPTPPDAPGPPPSLPLRNGAMTEGDGKPTGWDAVWGGVTTSRDTAVFHTPPASLKVSTGGKTAQGSGSQMMDGAAGTKFTLSGWVKSQGAAAQVAVQSFDTGWKAFDFHQVQWIPAGADWKKFSAEVTLPKGTAHFSIALFLDGNGDAWLDDVQITDVQGP